MDQDEQTSDDIDWSDWTDAFTPMVLISWITTAALWFVIATIPYADTVGIVLMVIIIFMYGLLVLPFHSLGLTGDLLSLSVYATLAIVVSSFAFLGIKKREPTMLAISGVIAISLVGSFLAMGKVAERVF